MRCPQCQGDNEASKKFCRYCGAKLQPTCPACGAAVLPADQFCGECGFELRGTERLGQPADKVISERKHITALFADLAGFTALSERLDPEEVKDLMSRLFGDITKIIMKYEGVIEKFAGDAVMALFGIPWSHEDDPVRAIRAATEIHHAMETLSPKVRQKIGQPLAMHIGINTGLVVTGELALENGVHHVAGDTLNVASRLCSLAQAGETMVGLATYAQAEGFFSFERLEPVRVKGKAKPLAVYKLLCPKELPRKTHRISGLRATLIGRQAEMASLTAAVGQLWTGNGSVISIYGEAGTGKSRLIEEFKSTLDLTSIQWHEGRAYAYTQNMPYYPFIDLLNRMFHIEESDPPELAKEKARAMITGLVGDNAEMLASLGGILDIPHLEMAEINPDAWKARLHRAFQTFLSALVRRAPTIICLEDLHWADHSSLELLWLLLTKSNYPALFLCVHRDQLEIFGKNHPEDLGELYREVRLQVLSPSETQRMVGALLETETAPPPLQQVIQEKGGGNPFYVEEVINSLIESGALVRQDGDWTLTGPIQEIMVPATIQGVIAARVDRLDHATKEVLQEASVIGRTFYLEVLENIAAFEAPLDHYLHRLQELDLIRVGSTHPDVEYYFKHALIQEVVYNGLLKKHRRSIHERIGLALEEFFRDRSIEAWETLAFHFKRGLSVSKAARYLIKSGEKSLKRYALEEANQYYREAFDLLSHNQAKSKEEDLLLIDLLLNWCMVFYYLGRFEGMTELLLNHLTLAESIEDKAKIGGYYAWLGHAAFWQGARLGDSYRYLHRSLELGEETGDRQVIGSACSFLIKTCAEMGYLEEAVRFERRTQEFLELFAADIFFHQTFYTAKGYLGWFLGDKHKVYEGAQGILDYGQEVSSQRCLMVGNLLMGFWHFMNLDMAPAVEYPQKVMAQGDPYHAMFARLLLGLFLVQMREFAKAEDLLTQVIAYSAKERTEYLKTAANLFLGVALAAQGKLTEGIRRVEHVSRDFLEYQRNVFYCLSETILGSIYLQMLQGSGGKKLSFFLKNFSFLLKNVPVAGKKAEKHLRQAIQVARDTGAKGFLGQPCLQLGILFKLKHKPQQAQECLAEAVRVFQECEFSIYLERAQNLLDSLA